MARSRWCLLAVLVVGTSCKAGGCIAEQAGGFVGAESDVYCDRRYVTDGGQPAPFCQEVRSTLAGSQFADDCRQNHKATAGNTLCPRLHIIAGCKVLQQNDDKSTVYDWYYDVDDILAEAGPYAGADGAATFEDVQHTREDVAKLCADPGRYAQGAELVDP